MTGKREKIIKPGLPAGEETLRLARDLYTLVDGRKAENIVVLDLREVNSYFHLFFIATALSTVHLKSLVRDIHKQMGDQFPPGEGIVRAEDYSSGWVAMDFIDVVVHLFLKEQRDFYNLERLWGDAARISF